MRKPYQVRPFAQPRRDKVLGPVVYIHCGQTGSEEALFKDHGAVVVEKYCDKSITPERLTALMTFYRRTSRSC